MGRNHKPKMNWDRVHAEDLIARRRREIPLQLPQAAFAGDCAAHYRMNCQECEQTHARALQWEVRCTPHDPFPSEINENICVCSLPPTHDIHHWDIDLAEKAAREQKKLWQKYMDSL